MATEWEAAAEQLDWFQVLLNLTDGQQTGRDGQPCFHLEDGRFCGRARFWHEGDNEEHQFVSLFALLDQLTSEARRDALEQAAHWCEQQVGDFQKFFTPENAAQVIRAMEHEERE